LNARARRGRDPSTKHARDGAAASTFVELRRGIRAMNEVEQAEQVLNSLRVTRDAVVASCAELGEERTRLAFGVHALGDTKARRRLDEINRETALQDSELRSIDAAIAEAGERVRLARAAEVAAVNRQQAEAARKLAAELAEVFPYLDHKLAEAANALLALEKGFAQLRALGVGPSDALVRLNITRGLETWAHRLPRSWHEHVRDGLKFLAPHERQTFSQYGRAVEASLQKAIGREPPVPRPQPPPPKSTTEEKAA
jgi:hypothetical protein